MDDFAHSPQENKSIVNEASFIELFVALSWLCCVSIHLEFFFKTEKTGHGYKQKRGYNTFTCTWPVNASKILAIENTGKT